MPPPDGEIEFSDLVFRLWKCTKPCMSILTNMVNPLFSAIPAYRPGAPGKHLTSGQMDISLIAESPGFQNRTHSHE